MSTASIPQEEPLLELAGVSRSYRVGPAEVFAIEDVSLRIRSGEMVAVVGASGSGKSTLLSLIGCMERPSRGTYRVMGRDVGALDDDRVAEMRRTHFGYIFQHYHLIPNVSAAENVALPAIYAGVDRVTREGRATELLTRLGLARLTRHRPNQLSGGQQQRVSIARALINGGRIVLADEPTGALDSSSGRDVMDVLADLHAKGHTVIVVTHDMHVAARAERIIELSDGRIVSDRLTTVADVPPQPRRAESFGGAVPIGEPVRAIAYRSHTRLVEVLRMAWAAALMHRLRTVLAMVGIAVGVAAVIAVVGIGEGAKGFVLSTIRSIGTNTIEIYPGKDMADDKAAGVRTLVHADLDSLAAQPYVRSVSPLTSRSARVRFGNLDMNAIVSGVGEAFFDARGGSLLQGRTFRIEDIVAGSNAAVVDDNAVRLLFPAHIDPVGRTILVSGLPCTVIGVSRTQNDVASENKAIRIWLPYTAAATRLFGQQHFDRVVVRLRDGAVPQDAERSIVALLTLRHAMKDFFTVNLDQIVKTMESASRSLTLMLSLVALISLLVGGIGVMNVMLISVAERTGEIGVRMAVGARKRDVLRQFLAETAMICLGGALGGLLLAYLSGRVLSIFVTEWEMVLSAPSIAAAFACALGIGVAFGYVPARRATALTPASALLRG